MTALTRRGTVLARPAALGTIRACLSTAGPARTAEEALAMDRTSTGQTAYDPELEARIKAMRAFLDALDPGTDAEALKLLRQAFPELPLAERVAACGGWKD
jgi:hypothetical protein